MMPDKVIASNRALEVASSGRTDVKTSKYPDPKQLGGINKRKKAVPKTKRGFKRLRLSIKKPQRKVDKKSSITILPLSGKIWREAEKIRAVSPYTQISAPAQTMAKANLLEAKIIKPEPVIAERGEWEPQKR
jgi:hypothetical protein